MKSSPLSRAGADIMVCQAGVFEVPTLCYLFSRYSFLFSRYLCILLFSALYSSIYWSPWPFRIQECALSQKLHVFPALSFTVSWGVSWTEMSIWACHGVSHIFIFSVFFYPEDNHSSCSKTQIKSACLCEIFPDLHFPPPGDLPGALSSSPPHFQFGIPHLSPQTLMQHY